MKFIKKHSSLIVAVIVFILVLLGLYLAKSIFFPEENKAIYGNRLEGRDSVEISNETKSAVQTKLDEGTKSVTVRIAGRIIYIDVITEDATTKEAARDLGNKALEAFSDKEKAYYDIQILISNESNKDQFPIIGYKHHSKNDISWTKDR